MKKILIIFCIFLSLSACASNDLTNKGESGELIYSSDSMEITSEKKNDIIGKYICTSEYFSNEYFQLHNESVPFIIFYEDDTCTLSVNYFEGVTNIKGKYEIKEKEINVKLDLQWTIFEGTDSVGLSYMNDEYIFTITDENHLVINRGYYSVNAGDSFMKTTTESDFTTVPESENDMLGKYICSSFYYDEAYTASHMNTIPSILLLKDGICSIYVDHEGGRKIRGSYRIEGDKIYVSELRFSLMQEDPLKAYMDEEYVFTIVDEDHLTIDKGFYNVQAGDTFVRSE